MHHAEQTSVGHFLGGQPVSRQIRRNDGAVGDQRRLIEQPVVEVTAKAVQQDGGLVGGSLPQVVDRQFANLDRLGLVAALFGARFLGYEALLELSNEGIDLRVGYLFAGEHAQQRAHRQGIAGDGHGPAQRAGVGHLDGAGNLLRFDQHHLGAGLHGVRPSRDKPVAHYALGHAQAPLGHGDRLNHRWCPARRLQSSRRTARSVSPVPKKTARGCAALSPCRPVPSGPLNPSCATAAATSASMLQRGWGPRPPPPGGRCSPRSPGPYRCRWENSVRRSTTSHSIPVAGQLLRRLGRPVHHHPIADDHAVIPSRTRSASPNGMAYSSSDTSPATS